MDGIVNFLEERNIRVFGPNKIASQLEDQKYLQKIFVKNLMSTANFDIFENIED